MKFQDIYGKGYTVDIYKGQENSDTPVMLTAASNPLNVEYSNNDDFFSPMENMSGSIRIIDDGTVDIEELLPESNTERLVKVSSDTSVNLLWAFLSVEQYTQDYNNRLHEFELPIIGVLDAMDSVSIPTSLNGVYPMNYVAAYLLYNFLRTYGNKAGCFVEIPQESVTVWQNRIDTSLLFEEETVENEDRSITSVKGVSYSDALKKLCTLFGYTLSYREDVMTFRQNITKDISVSMDYYRLFVSNFGHANFQSESSTIKVGYTYLSFNTFEWRGDGHTRSVNEGANVVEVVAKLKKKDWKIELPSIPLTAADEQDIQYGSNYDSNGRLDYRKIYSLSLYESNFTNNLLFKEYTVRTVITKTKVGNKNTINNITTTRYNYLISGNHNPLKYGLNTVLNKAILSDLTIYDHNVWTTEDDIDVKHRVRAFMSKIEFYTNSDGRKQEMDEGLFVMGAYYLKYDNTTPMLDPDSTNYVARITSNSPLGGMDGILLLNFDAVFLNYTCMIAYFVNLSADNPSLYFALKCGGKWYHPMSRTWSSDFAYLGVYLSDGKIYHNIQIENVDCSDGYPVRITPDIVGSVELYVYPHVHVLGYGLTEEINYTWMYAFYFFLKNLSLEYRPFTDVKKSDKSENKYLIHIGKFREEVSVEVDYASDHNNRYSPSIIRVADEGSMASEQLFRWRKYIPSSLITGTEKYYYYLRPELKLLYTLKRYYEKKREVLSLEVGITEEMYENANRSIIENNGKWYVILSDSWNVREDRHTIGLYETEESRQYVLDDTTGDVVNKPIDITDDRENIRFD